ncbi:MAG: MBL fold metallo-hydrolase [Candidatus Rokubacteria bacterium]|nr:MBL fold metallo-hydrolase [Candidatus Rokubacteria bacterium]MBI2879495.1 MBL fold metallo-hydrolase [Candidatus Rokubacteria bacterium]
MIFKALANEASGCLAYLLGCGTTGVAALIDPSRAEIEEYAALAQAKGLTLTHVLDTHIHADHVSGARELAARTGAGLHLHEAAEARYAFIPLRDGQELELGRVRLRVLHTPGHTPESICLLVSDTTRSPDPWFVLTGDTLFVGDVGRPDFGGEGAAARLHDSLFGRLLALDDAVEVYPAHGAGSVCGRAMSAKLGSTIGFERRFNPALRHRDKEAFVRALMADLPPRPANFEQVIAKNRGVLMLQRPNPKALAPKDLPAVVDRGAVLVDIRHPQLFGDGHIAGSLNVWIDSPQFAERVGWFVPMERSLVLVAETEVDVARAIGALMRVGLDAIAGYLVGSAGVEESGLPVARFPTIGVAELRHRLAQNPELLVVDVREPFEWEDGHIPGARHIPMGQIPARHGELPRDRPLALICRGGPRSGTSASLLLRQGFGRVMNVWGGMTHWEQAGFPVESS